MFANRSQNSLWGRSKTIACNFANQKRNLHTPTPEKYEKFRLGNSKISVFWVNKIALCAKFTYLFIDRDDLITTATL
jgi:hypothetical protein